MKPTLPQGTRDFSPAVIRKRTYIFDTIRTQFELFGFEPLETPAFENIETLMGKYGEEGDKLIFKILNNGFERPEKHAQAHLDFEKVLEGKNVKGITERALKYDLTIPFARYVAMNRGLINFPFKRYQIQPVWRADRPQRGRYREFTQCDADIVGSKSLLNEIDLIQIYSNVFESLNISVEICINNRKILAGIAEAINETDRIIDITVAIDKVDKIGIEGVKEELRKKNFSDDKIAALNDFIYFNADRIVHLGDAVKENHNLSRINFLKSNSCFEKSENLKKGIEEIEYIIERCSHLGSKLKIDLTLARGLNYYTGTILEVKPLGIQMGSIGGGGRYDDLTGLFGVPDIPGVGISFGVDRIYDVMDELGLFPEDIQKSVEVMLVNFGEAFQAKNLEVLHYLRSHNISCELYPDTIKFDKQLKYANKKNVAFIILIGEEELQEGLVSVKNFKTGEQSKMEMQKLLDTLK